jgi:hypothetical protein
MARSSNIPTDLLGAAYLLFLRVYFVRVGPLLD